MNRVPMVDIHSHILPGIDDGARTLEESLEMLRIAAAAGTTDIVATPHANSEFSYNPGQIQQLLRDLSDKSEGLINLHLGCDFHLNYPNLQDALAHPRKYTINNHLYLMVELPEFVVLSSTRDALRQLIRLDIIPVITHPERNPSVQANLPELQSWVADGCLLQVTGQSLFGNFGAPAKRAAHALLDADLVHFIASDAHDCIQRSPDLSKAFKYILSRYGSLKAETLLVSHPAAVLSGLPLFHSEKKSKKFNKLFPFFK